MTTDAAAASEPAERAPAELTNRSLAAYAFMAVPLSFAGVPIYLHAPDFYAREAGLSLATIGTSLLLLRLVDAVQDPLIGKLSDRLSDRRHLIFASGLLLLGAGFWMVFHPVAWLGLAWFAAAIFICTTGFSIVSINLQAVGGLWHASSGDRARITGWREGAGLAGLLAAAVVPPLLGSDDDPARAFHLLTLIFLPLLALAAWSLFRWLGSASLDRSAEDLRPHAWRSLVAPSWRRHFFGIVFLNSFANAVPAILVIFFVRDRLEAETHLGLFLALYFLSGALFMPVWPRIARSIGKVGAWRISIVLAISTFGWAAFVGAGDVTAFAAVCVLSGAALGADLALPPAILADHIHDRRAQSDATALFAVLTFVAKLALAAASGLVLTSLGAAGYEPGAGDAGEHAAALTIAYAVLPCLLKIVVLAWLWRRSELQ